MKNGCVTSRFIIPLIECENYKKRLPRFSSRSSPGKQSSLLFAQLSKPYIKGLTLSGGHPLETNNFSDVLNLVREVKEKFPTKDIWLYTGYLYEELYYREISRILLYIDVLVDGPYVEEQRDITLAFRGSRNQRLINVPETLKQGKIITLQND